MKRDKREHKKSRIEQIVADMLKEVETNQKRMDRLEELTTKTNK